MMPAGGKLFHLSPLVGLLHIASARPESHT